MNPVLFFWSWIIAELVTFTIFASIFGIFLTLMLLIGASFYGRYLLVRQMQRLAEQRQVLDISQPSEDNYMLVGAVLFFVPGLFASLLGACFIFKALREAFGRKLWHWLHPADIYGRYKNTIDGVMVDVRRPDGSSADVEILPKRNGRRD